MEHVLTQYHFDVSVAVLAQSNGLQVRVLLFQLVNINDIVSNMQVFSDVRFDIKSRARATRMNRRQLKLNYLSVNNLLRVDAMNGQFGR